jgi:hypothetical protein
MLAECVGLVFLMSCVSTHGQPSSAQRSGAGTEDGQSILVRLAPDDAAPPFFHLTPAEKPRAIRLLVVAKREETGWHRELAIYVLASLGHEYHANRDALLQVWRKDGDDGTMALLIYLYQQGHRELLVPLLSRYDGWNAATTEGLGTFYAEELAKYPADFLADLSTFEPKRQLELCTAAGGTDGSGMPPGMEARVANNLKRIGGEEALRCARGVRTGNRDAEAANRDSSPAPPKK